MLNPMQVIRAEIADVAQVIHIACILESAVRGKPVSPHDTRVQARAAEIILDGIGAQMRAVATAQTPDTQVATPGE